MNELDKLIETYAPLSEPLSQLEMQTLKKKVLAKAVQKKKPYKLILALAAAMCLLAACGAAAIGLFDSMTNVNRTEAMVEKYSLTLDNPPSATVDGHTVTVQAVIRSDTIARVIYDVTGSERKINSWNFFRDTQDQTLLRIQLCNDGQPTGYITDIPELVTGRIGQNRQSGSIGKVPENDSIRYFTDMDLTENADTISMYILYEAGGAEVLQIDLPEPITEKCSSLPDIVFYPDSGDKNIEYTLENVTITPFRLTITGIHNDEQLSLFENEPDWNKFIRLYDANGTDITFGRKGTFFTAGGSVGPDDFMVELGSYDLIDPATVSAIEINGVKYPLP